MFRICIAGGRRVPVRIKGFTYLFLLPGLIQVLLGFHVHLPLGITPATSVSTTALNLCRVLIPLLNLAPIQVKSLAKPEYYQVGALEEQRKADQGRTLDLIDKNQNPISVPPEFGGGCSIVAYYSGGAWTFYYQTWGSLTYDRPAGVTAIAKNLLTGHWNYVHKARVEGKDHKQKPYKFFKALEYVKFYP